MQTQTALSGEYLPFDMTPTDNVHSYKTGEFLEGEYTKVVRELPQYRPFPTLPAPECRKVQQRVEVVDPWMSKEADAAYMKALLGF